MKIFTINSESSESTSRVWLDPSTRNKDVLDHIRQKYSVCELVLAYLIIIYPSLFNYSSSLLYYPFFFGEEEAIYKIIYIEK